MKHQTNYILIISLVLNILSYFCKVKKTKTFIKTFLLYLKKHMDVSIIIVNYNTTLLVLDCISSIKKYTKDILYEIIIVDNDSNEDIEEIFYERFVNETNIRFIKLSENIGFGRANNEGFRVAKGKYVLCLNPDTLLVNNAIKLMTDFLDNNPTVGICGGNLYDKEMKPTHSFKKFFPSILWEIDTLSFHKLEKLIYRNNAIFNHSDQPMEVAYITGADLMIRKDLLNKIGGYNSNFFMFFEETDLCLKAKKEGFKIMNVPEARIQHLEGQSYKSEKDIIIKEKSVRLWEESRLIFYTLNRPKIVKKIANYIYGLSLNICYITFKKMHHPIWKEYYLRRSINRELLNNK